MNSCGMAPTLVTSRRTGSPAGTAIEAGSKRRASVALIRITSCDPPASPPSGPGMPAFSSCPGVGADGAGELEHPAASKAPMASSAASQLFGMVIIPPRSGSVGGHSTLQGVCEADVKVVPVAGGPSTRNHALGVDASLSGVLQKEHGLHLQHPRGADACMLLSRGARPHGGGGAGGGGTRKAFARGG